MHAPRTTALCVVASVLLAGCGEPGAPGSSRVGAWTEAATLVDDFGVNGRPALAFTAAGHGVLALDGRSDGELTRVLAAEPGSAAFEQIGEGLMLAGPAPYGRDGVAFLRAPTPPRAAGPRDATPEPPPVTELGVSLGTLPGSLGDVQALARFDGNPREAQAAVGGTPRGDVAAAWVQAAGGRSAVRLALREPGGKFGPPTTFATARAIAGIALAYGDGGDLVVAFSRWRGGAAFDVAARVLRPGGRAEPVASLGPALRRTVLAAAVSPSGAAVVAWGTQEGDWESVDSPWTVRAALLSPGASGFGPAQVLYPGTDHERSAGPVSAAIAAAGAATVAWSGAEKGPPGEYYSRPYPSPVLVATSTPGGSFGAPQQLARNGAARGVVSAPNGATTVLWGEFPKPESVDDYVESLRRMYASHRPAGATSFEPARPLAGPEATVNRGTIALDPRSGLPRAAWLADLGAGANDAALYDVWEVDVLYASAEPL